MSDNLGNKGKELEELVNNAKNIIGQIQSYAESAKQITSENQTFLVSNRVEIENKSAEVIAASAQVTAAKTQISDYQTVIATKSAHIQDAQEHADKIRGDLDRALTLATQKTNETEGLKARVQSAADNSAELVAEIRASKASIEIDQEIVKNVREEAKNSSIELKALAEMATSVDRTVTEYKTQLAALISECALQLKTIKELLPGATSTGLAHAFDARAKTFSKPSVHWQWLFIGSVILLVLLSVTGVWHTLQSGKVLTYDELLRLWLARLPIAGALIWMSLHASHEAALAKRLEEDYGYKSAIASSFLGFHEQMLKIGAIDQATPLSKLCADTLTTIASPPGRIYDRHQLTVSPTDELKNAAKAVYQP